ncbi:MAG: hypothetical protein ACPGVO_21120 [Spirulinaceae cyanobacterium]
MALKEILYRLAVGSLVGGATLAAGSLSAQELPGPAVNPNEADATGIAPPTGASSPEQGAPKVLEEGSILSLAGGRRLMSDGDAAIAAANYPLAADKYQSARQVFNQLSNLYQQLSATFNGINSRLADSQRRNALESSQLRDQATYKLALVHQEQGQPELSVPLLVQVIRSQNPTSDLGQAAHRQLVYLGLLDSEISEIPLPPDAVPPENLISMTGGQRLLTASEAAIDRGDYSSAAESLQQARQVFNQLSNFHQQLAQSFSGIKPNVAREQRQKAQESAELRDSATYQLALVHRFQQQPELSVPLLIQIVRSQNPTSGLGRQAYQQLVELGFADPR